MATFSPTREGIYNALANHLHPRGEGSDTEDITLPREQSVRKQFWYALTGEFKKLEDAMTAALLEWFCHTTIDDIPEWVTEYGYPDACDPWGLSLCARVKPQGSTDPQYYIDLFADMGWTIDSCRWLKGDDAVYPGVRSTLYAHLDTAASPIMTEGFVVGEGQVGLDPLGTPDPQMPACIFMQILPARAGLIYEVD